MKLSLIVAHSRNRVIGKNNRLPWHLPADLKHFKSVTMGKPILMGRKTYESIGRPLPGRRNVVITRQKDLKLPGCDVFHSIEEALIVLQSVEEVMVIGGAEIYSQALTVADKIYLTLIEADVDGDAFFPVLDLKSWQISEDRVCVKDDQNQYSCRFQQWLRK